MTGQLFSILNQKGISKAKILDLAENLDQDDFAELISILIEAKPPANQKAAWLFNHAAKLHPDFFKSHYSKVIHQLKTLSPDGCKRDVLRGILNMPLQEEQLGLLVDITMNWLASFEIDVAVKYNSMRTLERIVKHYPELKPEFHTVLRHQLEHNTDTFKRQAQKLLLKG